MEPRVIDVAGLQALIDALLSRGFNVVGPTVKTGAIVNAPIRSVADLPAGWGDDQDAGTYRLRRRDDEALFGFASGAQSAKPVFFPTEEVLWRGRRTQDGFTVEPNEQPVQDAPYALHRRPVLRPQRGRDPRHRAAESDAPGHELRRAAGVLVHRGRRRAPTRAAPASVSRWAPGRTPSPEEVRRTTWR